MKQYTTIKKLFLSVAVATLTLAYADSNITINNITQNPEGIEYDKTDHTFLLSSLNASPIIKVKYDGTYKAFTSGDKFPLSTAGLQIDYKHNRLLVAGFNGMELWDNDPKTKGTSFLKIYNLKTGVIEKSVNLSSLVPTASAYFANDIAVDDDGNAYITDWYANVVYKVDLLGKATLFWENKTDIKGTPNGLGFKDGSIFVSLIKVNDKWLYTDYGLVKIDINNPKSTTVIKMNNSGFAGFDGMVIKENGNIVGVTNNQKTAGGNSLIELSSDDNWTSAKVIHTKDIKPSTTIAITQNNENYVIHQDFSN
ncbi:MAG TPA: hypothetical protein ENJ34_04035, partial [Epsilonproteobacteria bacterium]|nr:hypothetical protein [Campylobacterota bacterium]